MPGRGELRQRHSTNEGGRQLRKGTPGKGQGSAKARECSRNRRKAPWWGLKVYLSCRKGRRLGTPPGPVRAKATELCGRACGREASPPGFQSWLLFAL